MTRRSSQAPSAWYSALSGVRSPGQPMPASSLRHAWHHSRGAARPVTPEAS
ncbi:MAG: hypothetical protein IPQ15_06085 [Betaproteobacteria bacterium]|nr:hypothetical protein [Betaproteobacteria bacterium]